MFPDACGLDLADAVHRGADPRSVVPDEFIVVRGGLKPVPSIGTLFSAVVGPTLEAAGAAVPNGNVRVTTAGAIRRLGGVVEWFEEHSPRGTLNRQHVHVIEASSSCFSEPEPNPVPKRFRIDQGA
jgi:hypothetical protein